MGTPYSVSITPEEQCYCDSIEKIYCQIPDDIGIMQMVTLGDVEMDAAGADALVESSVMNPIGSPTLREIAAGRTTAAIIISDATRGVDTARVLPFVISELTAAGLRMEDMLAVVALGVHRDAGEDEMKAMLGTCWGKLRVVNHQPFDPERLVSVGTTSRGNDIQVNRSVAAAQIRIGIGKVEPHEFAGYSGGRKSVLPGIAGESSIRFNHRPEMLADPHAAPCVLRDNPVHLDMVEAARLLRMDFFVNLVQNARGMPVAAFSGDMVASHEAAVSFLEQRYGVSVSQNANIFLTTPGAPLNIDFYQAVKPLFGLYPVLKENDVVILYAECREGLNSVDMIAPFRQGDTTQRVLAYLMDNYRIQMDQALLLCKIYQKKVKIIVFSPGVSAAELRTMRMHPVDSLPAALEKAAAFKREDGEKPRLCIFPQAQRAVIRIDDKQE